MLQAKMGRPATEAAAAAEWINRLLASGPKPQIEIKKVFDEEGWKDLFSWRTLVSVKNKLEIQSVKPKGQIDGKWLWANKADAKLLQVELEKRPHINVVLADGRPAILTETDGTQQLIVDKKTYGPTDLINGVPLYVEEHRTHWEHTRRWNNAVGRQVAIREGRIKPQNTE